MIPFPNSVTKAIKTKTLLYQILGIIYLPFGAANNTCNCIFEYCWCILQLIINLFLLLWFYSYYTTESIYIVGYGTETLKFQDVILMMAFTIHYTFKNMSCFYYRHNTKILIESVEKLTSFLNKIFKDSHGLLYAIFGYTIFYIFYDLYLIYKQSITFYLIPCQLYYTLWQLEVNLIYNILSKIKQSFCVVNKRLVFIIESRKWKSVQMSNILNAIDFYDQIRQTANATNKIFGFSIATSVVISITLIGTSVYMQILMVTTHEYISAVDLIYTIGWSACSFITFLFITIPWVSTAVEVRKVFNK